MISHAGTPTAFRDQSGAVATFAYPESAARALGSRLTERSGSVTRRPGARAGRGRRRCAGREIDDGLARPDDAWLDAKSARSLLEAYGMPIVSRA